MVKNGGGTESKKYEKRFLALILAVVLILPMFAFSASAGSYDTYCFQSDSSVVTCIKDTNFWGSGKLCFIPAISQKVTGNIL